MWRKILQNITVFISGWWWDAELFFTLFFTFFWMYRLFYKEHVTFKPEKKNVMLKKKERKLMTSSGSFLPIPWQKETNKNKSGESYTNLSVCLSQSPALQSSWTIAPPARQKSAAPENKVPELSGVLTWRRFCFDCSHLGWHCFALSVPIPQVPWSGHFGVVRSPRTFHLTYP